MAQQSPTIEFEDVPLDEARSMSRGPWMNPQLYHALKQKIPHSIAFSGGGVSRSCTWLGKEVVSLPPPPRRTGHATRAAPSSSNWLTLQGLRWHTGEPVLQGYVYPNGYPTFPPDERSSPRLCDQSPGHVSTLSGWVSPYPTGYEFPVPFGCRHSLLGRPVPLEHERHLAVGLLPMADPIGVSTFRIGKTRRASWPLYAGSRAPSQPAR
jgi:hypothetical protein